MSKCTSKKYGTFKKAQAAARKLEKKHDVPEGTARVYRCSHCGSFHVQLPLPPKKSETVKVSDKWPRYADGTKVRLGDTAITLAGGGFIVNNISFDKLGVVLGSGHGYGRRVAYGEVVEKPTARQLAPYLSKWLNNDDTSW